MPKRYKSYGLRSNLLEVRIPADDRKFLNLFNSKLANPIVPHKFDLLLWSN